MNPDDFDAVYDGAAGLQATIDDEGVLRLPSVPRRSLIVISVESLERMMTHCFSQGRTKEQTWQRDHSE